MIGIFRHGYWDVKFSPKYVKEKIWKRIVNGRIT